MKIIMISRSNLLRPEERLFKIFNINERRIIYEKVITNKEFIGRLESGLYTFVDGHIYYGNNVIKIRYDLIEQSGSQYFSEYDICDQYLNIFILNNNEKVKSNTPLECIRSHRFGYIISDKIS